MMKLLLPILLILIIFSSCTKNFYAPALYEHDVSYMPKPSSFDSTKSATFISLGSGFNQAVNIDNTVSFGELNVMEAHAFKNTNLAYGVYGFAGGIDNSNYQNQTADPNRFSSKGFYGYGARASFNFYTVMGNVNFRYFGVEGHYSKEAGDFAAFRRKVSNLPDYNAITRTEMVTIGATSEAFWHSKNNPQVRHALRGFLGKTIGNFDQVKLGTTTGTPADLAVYLSVSYYLSVNQFWGAAELTKNDLAVPGVRLKVGYRF